MTAPGAGTPAATTGLCPEGCGCRTGTEDADARECGCDGPCTTGWETPAATAPGLVPASTALSRPADHPWANDKTGWLHEDGTECPEYIAPDNGTRWWCTEHEKYLKPPAEPAATTPGRFGRLAEIAYNGYAGDNTRPMWETLGEHQQRRWSRAAMAVCRRCEHPDDARVTARILDQQITGDEPHDGETPEDFAVRYVRWLEAEVADLRAGSLTGQAAGFITYGRIAYEAFYDGTEIGPPVPWEKLTDSDVHWIAAAQAVAAAVRTDDAVDMHAEMSDLRAERDSLTGRVAELVSEVGELRDYVGRLTRITTAWTRGMYCAWIDCQRGDAKAAARCLSEGLDGYDGEPWNGTETGTEWWERTKAEEGLTDDPPASGSPGGGGREAT